MNIKTVLDFLQKAIWLLKLPFLASSSSNFSTRCFHMLSKFAGKSAQKSSIFPSKATFARSLLFISLMWPSLAVFGATSSSTGSTRASPPGTTSTQFPSRQPQQPPQATEPEKKIQQPSRPRLPTSSSFVYTMPGTASFRGGEWVGNDNLYNLTKSIGVTVEILAPPSAALPFAETLIRHQVDDLLKKAGITPRQTTAFFKGTPLPFLHVLIMLQPIEQGFVCYCAARLFEEVKNERVRLPVEIHWQAITWERQEMLIFPTDAAKTEIEKTLHSFIQAFTERFQFRPEESR